MKKLSLAILMLGLSAVVNAAGYGVIDLEKVVESSQYLKQQNASLEASIKPQASKLEQLNKELTALQKQSQTQGTNLKQIETQ